MTLVTALQTLDEDLAAACDQRHNAWRRLMIKDNPANRDTYTEACALVDGLLDLRYQIMAAERIVTA